MSKQLIAGYKRFRDGFYDDNKDDLKRLAKGQYPNIAVISCCDSRVDPNVIFDATPGDLFVIRNIANLVPKCENDGNYHGTSAALEYAVVDLNVSNLVVLGHAKCGGIKALMDKEKHDNSTFVDQWMSIAKSIKIDILSRNLPKEEQYSECEKSTIAQSIRNLMTFPWIAERVEQEKLTLCGWYYDLDTGDLSCFNHETNEFESCL